MKFKGNTYICVSTSIGCILYSNQPKMIFLGVWVGKICIMCLLLPLGLLLYICSHDFQGGLSPPILIIFYFEQIHSFLFSGKIKAESFPQNNISFGFHFKQGSLWNHIPHSKMPLRIQQFSWIIKFHDACSWNRLKGFIGFLWLEIASFS